jgi:hypothetical protein
MRQSISRGGSYRQSRNRRQLLVLIIFVICIGLLLSIFLQDTVTATTTESHYKTRTLCQPIINSISEINGQTRWARTEIDLQTGAVNNDNTCPSVPVYFRADGTTEFGFTPWRTVITKENQLIQRRECAIRNIPEYDPSYNICKGEVERIINLGPWGPCTSFGKQRRTCPIEDACTAENIERNCTKPVSKIWFVILIFLFGFSLIFYIFS